jgi:predicted nucleotidyltransferase
MYLNRTDLICGVQADTMRKVLRDLADARFTAGRLATEFGFDPEGPAADAVDLVTQMLEADLVEDCQQASSPGRSMFLEESLRAFDDSFLSLPGVQPWSDGRRQMSSWLELTAKGRQFVAATFAKPVKRKTAEKALEGLLARVEEINADDDLAFTIEEVVLFGSLLDDTRELLGDVDVAVAIARRYQGEKQEQVRQARSALAPASADWLRVTSWGEHEIWSRLKNRSRTLSVADLRSMRDWLADKPHKTVFTRQQAVQSAA